MGDLAWIRSSRCETHSCVEVAQQVSSRRVGEAHCVSVATSTVAALVRDSKLGAGSPILSFTPAAWSGFVAGIKAGHFDLPGGDHA